MTGNRCMYHIRHVSHSVHCPLSSSPPPTPHLRSGGWGWRSAPVIKHTGISSAKHVYRHSKPRSRNTAESQVRSGESFYGQVSYQRSSGFRTSWVSELRISVADLRHTVTRCGGSSSKAIANNQMGVAEKPSPKRHPLR